MSHAGGRLPRTSSYERQSQWYASRGGWDAWKSLVISDKCSDMISFSSPKMVEWHRFSLVRHVVSSTWWMQMTNPSWRTHCRGLQLGLSAPKSSSMFGQDVAEHFYELLTNRAWAFEMNLGDVLLSDSWLMLHSLTLILEILKLHWSMNHIEWHYIFGLFGVCWLVRLKRGYHVTFILQLEDMLELHTPILIACNKSDLSTARSEKFIVWISADDKHLEATWGATEKSCPYSWRTLLQRFGLFHCGAEY